MKMTKIKALLLLVGFVFVLVIQSPVQAQGNIDDYSWMRGANYVPSYAKNDVGIWMDYDPVVIDRELGYAAKLKLNTIRVF